MPTIRALDTSSAATPNPWDFWVDNQTGSDDYTKINNAVSAATAYALANGGYAAIRFQPRTYTVGGPLQTSQQGNAQIPLPVIALDKPSVTLAFLGAAHYAAPNPYFHQTATLVGGTVIQTTLTGQAVGASGAPSVIGGPTPENGYGYNGAGFDAVKFDNLLVIMDGITVATQFESGAGTMRGVDLSGVSKAHIQSLSCMANATITQFATSANRPVHPWSIGLYMPQDLNNDNNYIGSYTAYGFYTGLFATEHTVAQRVMCMYSYEGIQVHALGWHGVSIVQASIEAVQIALRTAAPASPTLHPVTIGQMSCESMDFYLGSGTFTYVDDPNNILGGSIGLVPATGGVNGGTIGLNGAANLTVTNLIQHKV